MGSRWERVLGWRLGARLSGARRALDEPGSRGRTLCGDNSARCAGATSLLGFAEEVRAYPARE